MILDRVSIDALLEESAEDLYEHAPCGYLSTLPDGTIVRVNQTFVEWTGASREALLAGTKFQTLLTIGSRIYYETHYAPLLRMQGFANEIALEVVRDDGRILPVLVNSRQKRDADGTPLFNRITLFDSTDRRRYERELLLARRKAEQVAKDKADLLAMLSHDIRNPLNALMGVVQLLDRSELDRSAAPVRAPAQVVVGEHAESAEPRARIEQGGIEQLRAGRDAVLAARRSSTTWCRRSRLPPARRGCHDPFGDCRRRAARADRRSGRDSADPHQSRRQCREVHGRRVGRRSPSRRRRSAPTP